MLMYIHGLLLWVQVDFEWMSTVNCTVSTAVSTVSQKYSWQHGVVLRALWSVLATCGREWWAPSGGMAAPNTHVRDCEWLNSCEGQLARLCFKHKIHVMRDLMYPHRRIVCASLSHAPAVGRK